MPILKESPHKLLWVCIPLFLALILLGPSSAIDVQNHDTYLVIALFHVGLAFAFKLFILGAIYWLLRKKKLIWILTAAHILLTILAIITLIIWHLFFRQFSTYAVDIFTHQATWIPYLIWIYLFAQVLFIVNIIYALIKGKRAI